MDTLPPMNDEQAELEAAERRGTPFLVLRTDTGRQQIVALDARRKRLTIGRRAEADLELPWDPEVSRLHAELERLAGEWTIADDGLSQNGTYVNEMRIEGRRRLSDGDFIRVGRTTITFHNPAAGVGGVTLLPGELSIATALSEQQNAVLLELCRPLMADGVGLQPASDERIAETLGIPPHIVTSELDALVRAFGFDDLPPAEARAEVALGAIRSGLVRREHFHG